MSWTSPKTWVTGDILPADELNTYLRDNLLELSPNKATTAGSIFVTNNTSEIAERIVTSDYIAASESTSSTTYTDLSTIGPSVTVETSSQAFVFMYCHMYSNDDTNAVWMNFDVSGATTESATSRDSTALMLQASNGQRWGVSVLYQNMTPGMNTFTAKYRCSNNTGTVTATWSNRRIAVLPL